MKYFKKIWISLNPQPDSYYFQSTRCKNIATKQKKTAMLKKNDHTLFPEGNQQMAFDAFYVLMAGPMITRAHNCVKALFRML